MTDLDHPIDILVCAWSFLGQHLHAGSANNDALAFQTLLEVTSEPLRLCTGSAHESTCSMSRCPQTEFHRPSSADWDPAARAHASWYPDALPSLSVVVANI